MGVLSIIMNLSDSGGEQESIMIRDFPAEIPMITLKNEIDAAMCRLKAELIEKKLNLKLYEEAT
jgi:hypothetical protein